MPTRLLIRSLLAGEVLVALLVVAGAPAPAVAPAGALTVTVKSLLRPHRRLRAITWEQPAPPPHAARGRGQRSRKRLGVGGPPL